MSGVLTTAHINIGILQTIRLIHKVSSIPLVLGLRTRMEGPSAYVVFWVPNYFEAHGALLRLSIQA